MPDISMCRNTVCQKRGKCYRYMVHPDKDWQSYSKFDSWPACNSFEPIEGRNVLVLENVDKWNEE